MANKKSQKRNQVEQINSSVVVVVAISAFMVVFALVASRALWTRMSYQNRVISAKEAARDQLRTNIDNVDELTTAYKAFVERPTNVIGGSSDSKLSNGGDNAKITLDSLPSKYDFPALTTSLEKLVKESNSSVNSITGTDDEIAQQTQTNDSVIEMPFELSATGSYGSIFKLTDIFNRSIRPIHITAIEYSGTNSEFTATTTAKTYYQPAKTLKAEMKVVK